MTPLSKYQSMLTNHDWFYEFSDDPSVSSAGRVRQKTLYGISKESDLHSELYTRWMCWYGTTIRQGSTQEKPKLEDIVSAD